MSFLILLDHSKVFYIIPFLLLHKLKLLCYDSNISRSCVPQGSILGSLLYSIYANDLPLNVEHCQIQMYAHDVQLYISCAVDDAPNCVGLISRDIKYTYGHMQMD